MECFYGLCHARGSFTILAVMRRRFFVDHFEDSSAVLTGDAAEHLGRVLRAEPGRLYELSDGQRVFLARIEHVTIAKHGEPRVEFSLLDAVETCKPLLSLRLLLSIVKFDRFEWALEKATELGVAEIIPLAAARTDRPLLAAAHKRRGRWQKILLESAQQSRRLRLPSLAEIIAPEKAFAGSPPVLKVLLSERPGARPLRQALPSESLEIAAHLPSTSLAIGPEGGWTEAEIISALAAGFAEASLGGTVLRTETAVVASLSVLRFALGE